MRAFSLSSIHRLTHRRWTPAAWLGFGCAVALVTMWGHADAPPGRYVVTNETVRDTKTMLTWQRAVGAATFSWNDALTYCMSLSLDGTGYRVPTAKELQTIVEDGKAGPAIDATAFPATPPLRFWTSSAQAGDANSAWLVSFDTGDVSPGMKSTLAPVRCVR